MVVMPLSCVDLRTCGIGHTFRVVIAVYFLAVFLSLEFAQREHTYNLAPFSGFHGLAWSPLRR